MKIKQLLTLSLLMVLSTWFIPFFQTYESVCAASSPVAPPVEWTKTYGYSGITSIQQTQDDGYVLFGSTGPYGWLIKTDSSGNMQWNKTFTRSGYETHVHAGQQTSDGGYMLAGGIPETEIVNGMGYGDAFMIKTDGSGNVQWEKTYGGSGHQFAFSAQETSDGGYVLAGTRTDSALFIKTDSTGNVIWSKTYEATTFARSVQQTSDGGYILAGEKNVGTFTDGWFAKTDANGNVVWNKTYGWLDKQDWINFVRTTADGGYIMTGCFERDPEAFHFSTGVFELVKIDSVGNFEWARPFTDTGIFPIGLTAEGNSVQQTTDGGFVSIGHFGSYESWLVKIDSNKQLLWTRSFTTETHSYAIQTSDRGYVVVHQTPRGTQDGASNITLIKIMRANPPIVSYTAEPSNPIVGEEVVFNASATYDLDNDISSYKWDFKDGNTQTTSNPVISHAFATAGIYNVTLTVTDGEELSALYAQEISVKIYTSLSLSASTKIMYASSPVTFSGMLSDSQGRGLGNVPVSIHYARSGSSQWNLIAEDLTNSQGNYNLTWNPFIIGKLAIKAEWTGNQTHYGANNVTNIEVLSNPTTLSIYLSTSTSNVGLKVTINGSLISNGIGLSNIPVLLSYSVTNGQTWNEISQPVTAFDGSYYAIWMPSATGEYIVKAVWAGNVTIQGATAFVDFAVVPFDAKNVFSLAPNSTVSSLSFESDKGELKFVVSGPDGTTGYVKVTIAKSLIADIQTVEVKLNNTEIDYTTSSMDDSWLLYFTYEHSSHSIIIKLLSSSLPFTLMPTDLALIGVAFATIFAVIIFLVFRKRRVKMAQASKL